MNKKILIALITLYLLAIHLFLIFKISGFEKVSYNAKAPDHLAINDDYKHYLRAESSQVKMFYTHGCSNCLEIRTYQSLIIDDDEATLTIEYKLYEDIYWHSERSNYFFGKNTHRSIATNKYKVLGECDLFDNRPSINNPINCEIGNEEGSYQIQRKGKVIYFK